MVGQSDTTWSAERSSWLASRILCGVQKGLHGWPVGYCVKCGKVFMVGQLDTVWSAESLHCWPVGYGVECRKSSLLASWILCEVQKGLYGWPVGYCVRAERSSWLAGRILYEEAAGSPWKADAASDFIAVLLQSGHVLSTSPNNAISLRVGLVFPGRSCVLRHDGSKTDLSCE